MFLRKLAENLPKIDLQRPISAFFRTFVCLKSGAIKFLYILGSDEAVKKIVRTRESAPFWKVLKLTIKLLRMAKYGRHFQFGIFYRFTQSRA